VWRIRIKGKTEEAYKVGGRKGGSLIPGKPDGYGGQGEQDVVFWSKPKERDRATQKKKRKETEQAQI